MSASEQEDVGYPHVRWPTLPGDDLGTFGMEEGTCFYDRDNPDAYVVSSMTVDVGSSRSVRLSKS